jgi:hypothetical protein
MERNSSDLKVVENVFLYENSDVDGVALDFNRPTTPSKGRPIVPLDHRTVTCVERWCDEYQIDNLIFKREQGKPCGSS